MTLLDTGAARSLLSQEAFRQLRLQQPYIKLLDQKPALSTVSGELITTFGTVRATLWGVVLELIVVRDLENLDIILGMDSLNLLKFEMTTERVALASKKVKLVKQGGEYSLAGVAEVELDRTIQGIIHQNEDVFYQEGRLNQARHVLPLRIVTEGDPVYQRPYRAPMAKRVVIETEIEEMLVQGVIEPSISPWASPVIIDSKICYYKNI